MANGIKPIKAFPGDGRPWRVDWFGAVNLNPKIHDEPTIEVIISPFIGDRNKPSSVSAVKKSEQKTIHVGIGQLPIIHIGSIWQDKLPLPLHDFNYDQKTFSKISITPETTQFIKANYKENGIIMPNMYSIDSTSGLNARCLCINYQDDPFGIIIPVVEIIRFYYAQSNALARILFNGEFCNSPEVLYNSQESFLDEDGFAAIKLSRIFSKNDAWIAARIAFSKVALHNARYIHETMRLNFRNEHLALPEVGFPFTGTTTLKAYTKSIPISGGKKWRSLVLWLDSCSAPFPFERLALYQDHYRDVFENLDNDDDFIESGWQIKNPKSAIGGEIKDDEPPSDDFDPIDILLNQNRFDFLNDKNLEIFPKERSKFRTNRKKPTHVNGTPGGYSTGGTTGGASNTAPINISIDPTSWRNENQPISASFDNFLLGLNKLEMKGLAFKIVAVPDINSGYSHRKVSFFPKKHKGAQFLWSFYKYKPKAERERRQVLVAEVKSNNRVYYLLEIQHRDSEHYTMLMAYNSDFLPLSLASLNEILLDCARNEGKWLDDTALREYKRIKIQHRWNNPEEFADKIIGLIDLSRVSVSAS